MKFKYIIDKLRVFKRLNDLANQVLILKNDIQKQETFVNNRMKELREFTRVDADIGFRGNNTIILTGVFNRQAYVKFYDMGDGEFKRLVVQLKDMQQYSLIRHMDKPCAFDFKGTFDL